MHDNDILTNRDLDETPPPMLGYVSPDVCERCGKEYRQRWHNCPHCLYKRPDNETAFTSMTPATTFRYSTRTETMRRVHDFETFEIERLNGEVTQLQGRLDAIRTEWHMVHATCPVPVFVRDWFRGLGLLIEGGE